MECVITAKTTPQVFTVNSVSISFTETWVNHLMMLQFVCVSTPFEQIINNYSLSPKWALSHYSPWGQRLKEWIWIRGPEGKRSNFFSKIQLVGQKNIEAKHLAFVKARLNPFLLTKHYKYGGHFLLLVGYNMKPCSSSTNQNAALIIDHYLDFTKIYYYNYCFFFCTFVSFYVNISKL